MNDVEIQFNATLWDTHRRQWNTSRNLGKHMKLDSKKDENIEFISMSLSSQCIFNENIREISKEKKEGINNEIKAIIEQELALFSEPENNI